MDIQECVVCTSKFDFDETGFKEEVKGKKDGKVVCSETCANTFAAERGTRVVLHDKNDAIVARNHEPGGALKRYGH